MELGAESERWWRTNELGSNRTEDRGYFCNNNCQGRHRQNWRGRNRLRIKSGMSGRADRTGVVRSRRVLGMRVRRLHRPHHAHQDDTEHTHGSEKPAPI